MYEGYVRDTKHPSHAETPLYKGIPEENVRDGGQSCLIHYLKPLASKKEPRIDD